MPDIQCTSPPTTAEYTAGSEYQKYDFTSDDVTKSVPRGLYERLITFSNFQDPE